MLLHCFQGAPPYFARITGNRAALDTELTRALVEHVEKNPTDCSYVSVVGTDVFIESIVGSEEMTELAAPSKYSGGHFVRLSEDPRVAPWNKYSFSRTPSSTWGQINSGEFVVHHPVSGQYPLSLDASRKHALLGPRGHALLPDGALFVIGHRREDKALAVEWWASPTSPARVDRLPNAPPIHGWDRRVSAEAGIVAAASAEEVYVSPTVTSETDLYLGRFDGHAWTSLELPGGTFTVLSMAAVPGTLWVALDTQRGGELYRSDRGEPLAKVNVKYAKLASGVTPPESVFRVWAVSKTDIFILTDNGLYRSLPTNVPKGLSLNSNVADSGRDPPSHL